MDYEALGQRVKRRRNTFGLTQEALAEKIGLSASYMGHIERGTRKASVETLVKLAQTLCTSLDYLLMDSYTHLETLDAMTKERLVTVLMALSRDVLDGHNR